MNKDLIEKLVANSEDFQNIFCPRCGRVMEQDEALRALSRYVNAYICSECGVNEALQEKGEAVSVFECWQIYIELLENISTVEGRRGVISCIENGIYTGKNIDGETILLKLEQGKGMTVSTIHKDKPKWFEVIEYDADGWQCSVSYEPTGVEQ